jgi:hypothetical protein
MSHDLMLGPSSRRWSRDSEPPAAPPSRGSKVALGAMALGTGAGLLGIVAGWWRAKTPHIPIVREQRPTIYFNRSPEGNIMMNTARRITRY